MESVSFKIPFIPMFALKKDDVKFNNKHFITAKQFGRVMY